MAATSRLGWRPSIIGLAAVIALLALAACAPAGSATGRSPARTLPHATGIGLHRPTKGPPAPAAVTIMGTIGDFSFSPATLTIKAGTTVTWTNTTDTMHTVTSDFNGAPMPFGSPLVQPSGGTFSFTFIMLGVYHYHCSIHPTMHGTIVVVPVG